MNRIKISRLVRYISRSWEMRRRRSNQSRLMNIRPVQVEVRLLAKSCGVVGTDNLSEEEKWSKIKDENNSITTSRTTSSTPDPSTWKSHVHTHCLGDVLFNERLHMTRHVLQEKMGSLQLLNTVSFFLFCC